MYTLGKTPKVTVNIKAAEKAVSVSDPNVLLIGQGDGTSTFKKVYENVDTQTAPSLFGEYSLLTYAIKRFKKYNSYTNLDVIALESPSGGSVAAGHIEFTGTAVEAGEIEFYFFDDEFGVKIDVAKGDTAEHVATRLNNAITSANNQNVKLPFTAGLNGSTQIDILTRAHGAYLNNMHIRANRKIAGLDVVFTETTRGSGSADIAGMFLEITKQYNIIAFDGEGQGGIVSGMREFLEKRFNSTNQFLGGVGVFMSNETKATAEIGAATLNAKTLVYFNNFLRSETTNKVSYTTMPLLFVAWFSAVVALRMTDGADINDFVMDTVESIGSVSKATLPYQNIPTPYLASVDQRYYTQEEIDFFDKMGINVLNNTPAGGTELRYVNTLYRVDALGNTDTTYKYLNTVQAALVVQEYLSKNLRQYLAQKRLTNGDVEPGVAMTNESTIKGKLNEWYLDLIDLHIVQAGSDAIKTFKEGINLSVDTSKGRVTGFVSKILLVGGVREVILNVSVGF